MVGVPIPIVALHTQTVLAGQRTLVVIHPPPNPHRSNRTITGVKPAHLAASPRSSCSCRPSRAPTLAGPIGAREQETLRLTLTAKTDNRTRNPGEARTGAAV